MFSFMYSILLEKAASELEIIPGEEFRAAYEVAKQINASVVLGDRPVEVTLKRMWMGLTMFEKFRLVLQLLFSGINMPSAPELRALMENMRKKTDLITEAVEDLGRSFPWIVESLINERDQYMVITLRQALMMSPGSVVAVVGAGHIPGITRTWERQQQEMRQLAANLELGTETETSSSMSIMQLLAYPGDQNAYTLVELRQHVTKTLRARPPPPPMPVHKRWLTQQLQQRPVMVGVAFLIGIGAIGSIVLLASSNRKSSPETGSGSDKGTAWSLTTSFLRRSRPG